MKRTSGEQIEFLNRRVGDGGFLQSEEWRLFQEAAGRKTFRFEKGSISVNVIEHMLPLVGKYWYIPRGPVFDDQSEEGVSEIARFLLREILEKAKRENIGWIRFEPNDEKVLGIFRGIPGVSVRKSPHNMQPEETFVIDVSSPEEEILARMKSKTRYNIRLASKKGVKIFTSRDQRYIDAFCDLVEVTAKRDGIISHSRAYYQKMLQTIPEEMLRLYVAEYEGRAVAANLVLFFGEYATYLHGASDNAHREAMATYLLQWQQIRDAKKNGCARYDFGGVKMKNKKRSWDTWAGITRFKQGFSPHQSPVIFLGSYDLLLRKKRYTIYNRLQEAKYFLKHRVLRWQNK